MKQIIFSTILLVLIACNTTPKESDHEHDHDAGTSVVKGTENHEHKGTSSTVILDNGKKWKANRETTDGINKMKALTHNGIAEHKEPLELFPDLQYEFKTIFEKCTMKGEAHDQLHNFLIPVKAQLDNLKSDNASAENLRELQHYLDSYSQYFE